MWVVKGSTHSQKNGVEANFASGWPEVLKKHAVLLIGFKLAPGLGSFAILDFHKVHLLLVGSELTGALGPGRRKGCWCLRRGPHHPLCTLPCFFMHTLGGQRVLLCS